MLLKELGEPMEIVKKENLLDRYQAGKDKSLDRLLLFITRLPQDQLYAYAEIFDYDPETSTVEDLVNHIEYYVVNSYFHRFSSLKQYLYDLIMNCAEGNNVFYNILITLFPNLEDVDLLTEELIDALNSDTYYIETSYGLIEMRNSPIAKKSERRVNYE